MLPSARDILIGGGANRYPIGERSRRRFLNRAVDLRLVLASYADQSEFDVRGLLTAKRYGRAWAHGLEIFFPLARGEHQDQGRSCFQAANHKNVPVLVHFASQAFESKLSGIRT